MLTPIENYFAGIAVLATLMVVWAVVRALCGAGFLPQDLCPSSGKKPRGLWVLTAFGLVMALLGGFLVACNAQLPEQFSAGIPVLSLAPAGIALLFHICPDLFPGWESETEVADETANKNEVDR